MRRLIPLLAVAAAMPFTAPAQAATVLDPLGDYLPSFTGSLDPDLDVLSFTVNYDSALDAFILGAALAGEIDSSLPGLYAIGVNTGTGAIAPFASIGAPNVRFDQVIVINKDGTGLVTGAAGGALDPDDVDIIGNLFTAIVPLSLLPSTGNSVPSYGFNLWPRNGLGSNDQISDFAPDDGLLAVNLIPEPMGWALMIAGFGLVGAACRRNGSYRLA